MYSGNILLKRLLRYVETGSQPVQEMFFLPKERRIEMVIRSPCGARATRLHRRWSSESPEGVDLPQSAQAVLPNDLRWLHPKPVWLERLFGDWTLAWATTDSTKGALCRFTESVERLNVRHPAWVRTAPTFWARGLVEFCVDDIVADISR